MDPSANECIVYDSLKQEHPVIPEPDPLDWYQQTEPVKLTAAYAQISSRNGLDPVYCDNDRYKILQLVKDAFNKEKFIEARDATNPYEKIGRSIFINRAGVKLANIDAVHHITGDIFKFDRKQSDKALKFADVAAGPGGFTQYLQYRYPNSKGYGMTLRHEKLDWSTRFIDTSQFTPFYGPDNTGNLYTNWSHFNNFVTTDQQGGVDLVTGDGGFDLEDNLDKKILHHQEFLSSRLLLTQVLVGLGALKIGGNFLVKVFDTVTTISSHILFVLAQCFERILIFKPVSSRPANAERYVICINRKPDIKEYYQLLAQAAAIYTDDLFLSSLFIEPISRTFEQWLTRANNQSIDRQLQAAQNILIYLNGKEPQIPQYNIAKFLTIWNVPDTPLNVKRSKIHIL